MKKRPKTLLVWLKRHPYIVAYTIGLVYFLASLAWLKNVRTADMISQVWLAKAVSISAYVIMSMIFATSLLVFVFLYKRLKIKLDSYQSIWLIPAIWIVADYLRSIIFSVASLGPGGRIGDFWNFGSVGMWLVNTPIVYAARLGGPYLLSALVVAIIVATINSKKTKSWFPLAVVIFITGLLSFVGWLAYKTPTGPGLDVVTVSLIADQSVGQDSRAIDDVIRFLPAQSTDALYLPEYSHFWMHNPSQDTKTAQYILRDSDSLVIHSAQSHYYETVTNNVQYATADGSVLYSQAKWFVIPGGEYVPYFYQSILRLTNNAQLIKQFETSHSVSPAKTMEAPFRHNGVAYGALACSAINVPTLYRSLANHGATILSNAAALSTPGLAQQYHNQSRDQARFQAIANARPFVQSARGSYSFVFDHNGQLLVSTTQQANSAVSVNVSTNSRKTIYTILGDWILLAAVVLISASWYRQTKTNHKKSDIETKA